MITCKHLPEKQFETQEELFKELAENADKIIALKKANVYEAHKKAPGFSFIEKGAVDVSKIGPHLKQDHVYPVINTTNYMDGHDDVHFPSLWNRSVKNQAGKIFYVSDHKIETNTIIAWPEDVTMMVKSIPWKAVGKDYEGNTEALIFEISKSKIVHDAAKRIIEEKRPVQNSVRMVYVKIEMGMNSTIFEHKKYKEYYDNNIEKIINREIAEEKGYFFGVEEAKIEKEGSMVILGSNDATAIMQKSGSVPDQDSDSSADTHTKQTRIINPNFY